MAGIDFGNFYVVILVNGLLLTSAILKENGLFAKFR